MDKIIYAVGYCRFSSDNQRNESIDAQKRAIQNYADENNIIITNWYLDYAQSGTSADRKEFQKMIESSKHRNFTMVLVHKLDRFSRDKDDTALYKVILKRNGVKVFSVTEKFDESPEGVLMESLIEGLAAYYSKNLARETLKGMTENAYNAKSNGSVPPYGYKLVPRLDSNKNIVYNKKGAMLHDIALDEEKSEAIKLIFARVIEGKTYPEIIEELSKKGFKTSRGNYFTTSSILNILRNEKYTGTYIFNKYRKKMARSGGISKEPNEEDKVIKVKDGLPKIIEEDTFNLVQQILDARIRQTPGINYVDYLLSGKIICGECGSAFTGERQRKVYKDRVEYRTYYRCNTKRGNLPEGQNKCANTCIRQDEIEKFVLSEISRVVFSKKNFDCILELYTKYQDELLNREYSAEAMKRQIVSVENKIKNITEAIAELGFSTSLKNQLEMLETQKRNLENELSKNRTRLGPEIDKKRFEKAYNKLAKLFEDNKLENTKLIIDALLNRVVVYNDRVEVYINILPSFNYEKVAMEITAKDILEVKEKGVESNSTPSSLVFSPLHHNFMDVKEFGSPSRTRTYDNSVNSRVLYRLSYRGILNCFEHLIINLSI